ncbi:Alpha/beta hydrolase family protein [Thalassoglobus polymorphus]|uniref:Alpha/beta hydrolase family protein n=2 Tax=Thalassoglobus polymorphus TaxID=2527994 RepID=A0A517QT08_9PLAN|nr:Alpha/beta hydrolase family protein [Thalassoglobus polymorphus]
MKFFTSVFILSCSVFCLQGHAQDAATSKVDHSDLTYYLDEAGTRQPVKTKSDWEKRRKQIIAGMEEAMGPLPDRSNLVPLAIEAVERTQGDGYRRTTVTFAADKNDRVPADIYYPDPLPEGKKVPGVIALHPTGAQGKRIVAGDGPRPNRQYAVELAQRGYVVVAPDYPSFGDYKDYDFESDDYVSGTMKGIFNHMRCVDLLEATASVDPERIGVIGHSLGGHNAMFVGAFDDRIDVVVTSCGWTPFHDYYEGNIKGWTSNRYMPLLQEKYGLDPDKVPFDFYEVVASLAPRAFFSSSPKEDSNFEINGVKKAIPRALGVYSLFDATDNLKVVYPDCDHDFPTETREQAYEFIDKALGHTPRQTLDFAAELPRIAGKSPAEAMKTFDLVPGFKIEQTASEPMVTDPVAMSFDENGRLYVVEMKDYSEQDTESLGQVRLLTDTDGDGKFDKSVVFADNLSWPTAIICSQGGVFVGAAPDVYFLRDTNADGKADERKVVFTGFQRTNVQGLVNSFRWGMDNRIHGATSSSGGLVKRVGDKNDPGVNLRGRDFSFDPIKLDLRAESGGAQHGMSFDDWGRKFVCSNSDHAQMVMYDDLDIARNPAFKAPGPRTRIADDGAQAPVFRTSQVEPWRIVRTRLRVSKQVKGVVEGGGRPAGYFTGATGITLYRGDAYGEDAKGTVFVGDVGSNIVHRKKLTPKGATFVASRIDENREFLRSTDVWFRPVQYANAPDGCLHVLDMYRETIEHPKSLPPEIKRHLDLTSGRDRGRLYRVVPEGGVKARSANLGQMSTIALVEYLDHTNSWHRDTASRLLFERKDPAATAAIIKLASTAKTPYGKVHALSLLQSLGKLPVETLAGALKDQHPRVREVAVRLAKHHPDVRQLSELFVALKNDPDARVRYELAYTSGALAVEPRAEILAELLAKDGTDRWVFIAAMSSLNEGIETVFFDLISRDKPVSGSVLVGVFEQLATQSSNELVVTSLKKISGLPDSQTSLKANFVTAALQRKPALRSQLDSGDLKQVIEDVVVGSRAVAFDAKASSAARVQAIDNLKLSKDEGDSQKLLALLVNTVPQQVQSAAINTLTAVDFKKLSEELVSNWAGLSPAIRLEAEEALFGRSQGTDVLLSAVEDGDLKITDLSLVRLQALQKSKDAKLKARVDKLLKNSSRPTRTAVIEKYREALSLSGNPGRGRQVFLKNCATCHRLNEEGTEIGPNLATIQNRGADTILLNVLDPNREVNPQYVNYLVLMQSGKTHTGMISDETATSVTLLRAEKKTDTLLRSDIEEMRSSGLSIMPEGLEKEITVPMFADLIAYLMSIQ